MNVIIYNLRINISQKNLFRVLYFIITVMSVSDCHIYLNEFVTK